mgnify:FL=1
MKICIIKLGALGDVVRTTPILLAVKEKYPDSKIIWITIKSSYEILEGNHYINKILTLPLDLDNLGEFDILYSLDIEEEATKLALKINAKEKFGYYDNGGFPSAFNEEANYYLNTVFDDDLKKSNRKTYQEMIFEICKLPWKKQKMSLFIPENSKHIINNFLIENNLKNKKILGLNIGSSKKWPSKAWHKYNIIEFIMKVKERGYEIILLGGLDEKEKMNEIEKDLLNNNIKIYSKNTSNSLKDFFALINICNIIICADTLALHVALGLNKIVIALFFCTSSYEIEGYSMLKKITSPMLFDFFPAKMDQYDEALTKSISVDEVLKFI